MDTGQHSLTACTLHNRPWLNFPTIKHGSPLVIGGNCFLQICVLAVGTSVFVCFSNSVWLVRIHLSVCVCMSVCFPPCHPPDPQCKCASADKEPAGIQRSANTVCTTLNTEHTLHKHCTIVQYSTEHKDNPKTALLCFNCYNTRTLHASHCGCCKHKMHCRDLTHCTACIGELQNYHLHTALDNKRTHCTHYVLDCFLSTHLMSAYCVNALAI